MSTCNYLPFITIGQYRSTICRHTAHTRLSVLTCLVFLISSVQKVMFCFIMRISSCGFGEVSLILKSKFYMYFDA